MRVPRAAPGESDVREALVLERITGNLCVEIVHNLKQAWFHVAGGTLKLDWIHQKKSQVNNIM